MNLCLWQFLISMSRFIFPLHLRIYNEFDHVLCTMFFVTYARTRCASREQARKRARGQLDLDPAKILHGQTIGATFFTWHGFTAKPLFFVHPAGKFCLFPNVHPNLFFALRTIQHKSKLSCQATYQLNCNIQAITFLPTLEIEPFS